MATSVKIDFFVPGFSKCGTTTLAALLAEHPDIFIPDVKEPWYFCANDFEQKHNYYNHIYKSAEPNQLKGDCSTSYSSFEKEMIATKRISSNNPKCKFIFIARKPKSRMMSSYKEMHHSAANFGLLAPYKLGQCLEAFPQIVQDSLYWERLKIYKNTFGDNAIRVVFMEDMIENRRAVLEECFTHLGIDAENYSEPELVKLNDGEQKRYDRRLLRFLRKNRLTRKKTSEIAHTKPEILRKYGLRPTFGKKKIKWDVNARKILEDIIDPDSRVFLENYGKTISFWNLTENQTS